VLVGFLIAVCVAAALPPAWAATGKSRDLVVLDHERWLDTLKGTVKNYGKRPARDVTVVVKFFDRKKKALGTQRVNVATCAPGTSRPGTCPSPRRTARPRSTRSRRTRSGSDTAISRQLSAISFSRRPKA
jgi:hypothetical protein